MSEGQGQQCVCSEAQTLRDMASTLGRMDGTLNAVHEQARKTNGSVAELFERTNSQKSRHDLLLNRMKSQEQKCEKVQSCKANASRTWREWARKLVAGVVLILAGMAITNLLGCAGAAQQIAGNVSEVRTAAARIHTNATRIDELSEDGSEVDDSAKAIQADAETIQTKCIRVQRVLPKVTDKETWLDRLVRWGLPILGIGVLVGAAVYFGVGKVVRPIMQRLGRWISPSDKRDAALDAKVAAGDISISEAVAARRASRPGYEAAREQLANPPPDTNTT